MELIPFPRTDVWGFHKCSNFFVYFFICFSLRGKSSIFWEGDTCIVERRLSVPLKRLLCLGMMSVSISLWETSLLHWTSCCYLTHSGPLQCTTNVSSQFIDIYVNGIWSFEVHSLYDKYEINSTRNSFSLSVLQTEHLKWRIQNEHVKSIIIRRNILRKSQMISSISLKPPRGSPLSIEDVYINGFKSTQNK